MYIRRDRKTTRAGQPVTTLSLAHNVRERVPDGRLRPKPTFATHRLTELKTTKDPAGTPVVVQHWRLASTTVASSTRTYGYNPRGAMTTVPHVNGGATDALQVDFRDQVRVATLNSTDSVTYAYDGSGQRVRKLVKLGQNTEERITLGGWELYRKWNEAPSTPVLTTERESLHVMDGEKRIVLVETLTVDNSSPVSSPTSHPRYQLGDHLGSACLELDDSADVITYEEYHPFGTVAWRGERANYSTTYGAKRYRYTGMERDDETGMQYHSARYYLPWLGRWASSDPIGLEGGINRYAYASGRPTGLVDPSGNLPVMPVDETATRGSWTQDMAAQEPLPSWISNRVRGAARFAGGVAGMVLGATGLAMPEPSTSVAGLAVAFYSLDQADAGLQQTVSGEPTDSVFNQALTADLEAVGVDPNTAKTTANTAEVVVGVVLEAGAARGLSTLVDSPPRSPVTALDDGLELADEVPVLPTSAVDDVAETLADASKATAAIRTPWGQATQHASDAALAARGQVSEGATLYRVGTTGRSNATGAQFWSLEHPSTPGFAARHGIPPENVANANFIQTATLKPGASFVTRPAPGVSTNAGGGLEVVVEEGGVVLQTFHHSGN